MTRDLGWADLDIAFAFSRPIAAPYLDAAGAIATAPADAPRRDHDAAGAPIGLIVDTGPYLGAADRLRFDPLMLPADFAGEEATVLHATYDGAAIVRRAWYSRDAAATIDALLTTEARHVSIGTVAGHIEPVGGVVRYRGQGWTLAAIIADGADGLAADGAGRPIIEG